MLVSHCIYFTTYPANVEGVYIYIYKYIYICSLCSCLLHTSAAMSVTHGLNTKWQNIGSPLHQIQEINKIKLIMYYIWHNYMFILFLLLFHYWLQVAPSKGRHQANIYKKKKLKMLVHTARKRQFLWDSIYMKLWHF